MKKSLLSGLSFGLTSGVITTLGLMIGLSSSTNQKSVVISGILTIALADGLSDALGVHLSGESEEKSQKRVWEETITTFLSKLFFALTFLIPVITLKLTTAIIISIIYGLSMITILTYYLSRKQNKNPKHAIIEHLIISIIVIMLTRTIGLLIKKFYSIPV